MKIIRTAVLAAISLTVLLLVAGCSDKKADQAMPPGGGEINPQYSEDVRMYEQALAADPNNKDILINLGNRYFDWGEAEVRQYGDNAQPVPKWTKGIDYYRRALEIDPANADVRTDMAILMNWIGKFDEAEKEYRTAIRTNPKHTQSRVNLILLLGKNMGRHAEAIKEYDALIEIAPDQKNNTVLMQEVDSYRAMMKGAGK